MLFDRYFERNVPNKWVRCNIQYLLVGILIGAFVNIIFRITGNFIISLPDVVLTFVISIIITLCIANISVISADIIKVKFSLFKEVFGTGKHESVSELKPNEMLMLSINTSITVGTVIKIDKTKEEVEFSLKIPVVPLIGESVGLARNLQGHWRLIGFGEII